VGINNRQAPAQRPTLINEYLHQAPEHDKLLNPLDCQ
jgi:hypothetical protein